MRLSEVKHGRVGEIWPIIGPSPYVADRNRPKFGMMMDLPLSVVLGMCVKIA